MAPGIAPRDQINKTSRQCDTEYFWVVPSLIAVALFALHADTFAWDADAATENDLLVGSFTLSSEGVGARHIVTVLRAA